MNIFINLFLVIMILLTKSTCFRKFFMLYISRSSTFSRSNFNTYIALQSFRTILQLKTFEIPLFYKGLCIFAIFSINFLNFTKSDVQRIFFQNTFKKIGNALQIFIFVFLVPVIWQFNAFCITVFFTVIIIMILALVFIVFTALFVNIFMKLSYIIGIFSDSSISICISFLRIIFRIFYYFMFGCLFLLVFALLLCAFVNVLYISYLVTNFNDYDSSSGSTFHFHFHANIDKDVNFPQSNNNASSKNLWLPFSASFLFLKIWFSKSGNITLRLFLFLVAFLLPFLHKHIKTSNHQETIRSCSRYGFFTPDFIDTCKNIQSFITQLTINHYSTSKLKYQNLNSFSHLLLLLSGDISLNPGPVHQDKLQCSNEWNVFKNRGLHFIHLNINGLLPKIEELRFIAKSNNAAVIGICESKLDASVVDPEISTDNYKTLRCDRNRQGGGAACYVRNDLSYNTLCLSP